MDIRYIEPFIEATVGVFKDMFGENPEYMTPYLISPKCTNEWEISGIIGIAGDSKGVVVVSLSSSLATTLTAKLMGSGTPSAEDVADAVGEVVNIVAGNAKKGLEEFRLSISLPSIVRGPEHTIAWKSDQPIIGIPFKIPQGKFHLSVGLENII